MGCDVFISCASVDAALAHQVGVSLAWHGMTSTSAFGSAMGARDRVIAQGQIVIVLLSEAANASRRVDREVVFAVVHGLQVVVVAVDDDVRRPRSLAGSMPSVARLDTPGPELEAQLSQLSVLVAQRLLELHSIGLADGDEPQPQAAPHVEPPPEVAPSGWWGDYQASPGEGPAGMAVTGEGQNERSWLRDVFIGGGWTIAAPADHDPAAREHEWQTCSAAPEPAELPDLRGAPAGRLARYCEEPVAYECACVAADRTDEVDFTVAWPGGVAPGTTFVLDVWAHRPEERRDVLERAKAAFPGVDTGSKSKSGGRLARGSELRVRLDIEGLTVDDPEEVLLWNGAVANADFIVTVPSDLRPGPRTGTVTVSFDGLRILRSAFQLLVLDRPGQRVPESRTTVSRHECAFASYASEDRDRVLARVQGMETVLPMRVFVDVDALRPSGGGWRDQLRGHIDGADVLYLFWSKAARASKHVDWEWRYALEKRGLGFIDPVPLEPPTLAPPPTELQTLHFNSKWLAYMRQPA